MENNIFKQLTTNLSFNQKDKSNNLNLKRKSNDHLVKELANESENENIKNNLLNVSEINEPQPSTPLKKKRLNESSNENENFLLTNEQQLNGSTSNTKANKIPKNLELIKKEEINHLRNVNNINVNGDDIPDPIENFDQLKTFKILNEKTKNYENINESLISNLATYKFSEPTPVQMQVIPIMLNNREVMVCAPTGSGKTISYLFPLLALLKLKKKKKGVKSVILSPTRELARQIYVECCRLCNGLDLVPHIINQTTNEIKKLKFYRKKYDILITTPIRLIHLLNKKGVSKCLKKVEWMIIDEADKLFEDGENGFRDQLGKIYKACDNPNVKHAMFSATFTNEVEQWCKLNFNNLVQVSIGRKNSTATGIEQQLNYVGNEQGKLVALKNLFKQGFEPPVLIFVQSKERANDLFKELVIEKYNVDIISAERSQQQRDNTIRAFRQGKIWILICTDLMSRGIDFKYVNLVINFDLPLTAISYVHRIGRSGRAGSLGKAVTFFTKSDMPILRSIANVIKEAGCDVPDYVLKLRKPSKKLKKELAKKAPKRKKLTQA